MTAERLHVAPQRRHLERHPVRDQRHGAVVDAGRHRLQLRRPRKLDDLVGLRCGGEIDFVYGNSEQRIAHRAADGARLDTVCIERVEDRLRLPPL